MSLVLNNIQLVSLFLLTYLYLWIPAILSPLIALFPPPKKSFAVMRFGSVAGLASAGLAGIAVAEDLLFYSTMVDTQEYIQATTVLGLTGRPAPERAVVCPTLTTRAY